jgi:hypothetical protein
VIWWNSAWSQLIWHYCNWGDTSLLRLGELACVPACFPAGCGCMARVAEVRQGVMHALVCSSDSTVWRVVLLLQACPSSVALICGTTPPSPT